MPSNTFVGQPLDLSDDRAWSTGQRDIYNTRGTDAYNAGQTQIGKNTATSDKVVGQALDTSKTAFDQSQQDFSDYNAQGRPALKSLTDYAMNYGTPDRMAANRAGAMAMTGIGNNAAITSASRSLSDLGVNPASGRYAGLTDAMRTAGAANTAAAGTKSDRDTEQIWQSLLNNAVQRNQVLPGQASNEAGLSTAAGTAAATTGLSTGQANLALEQPTGWVGAADTMNDKIRQSLVEQTQLGMQQNQQTADNLYRQQQLAAQGSSGIGAIAGGLLGAASKIAPMFMNGGGSIGPSGIDPSTVYNAGPQGSGAGGAYTPADAMGGGGLGSVGFRRGGRVALRTNYRRGGPVRKFLYGGDTSDLDNIDTYAHDLSSMDPTGYSGFATDALDFGRDISDNRTKTMPGDKFGVFGPTSEDQGEQIGGDVGRFGGRIIGSIFGMPGAGAAAGGDIGTGIGEMVSTGNFGKGFEDIGRGMLSSAEGALSGGGGIMGMFGGGGGGGGMGGMFAAGGDVGDPELGPGGDYSPDYAPDPSGDGMGMDDGMSPTPGVSSARVVPPEASPSGGEETDDVHALVNEGEFIIPKPVTNWYGEKFFQKLIEKAYTEMAGPKTAEPEMADPSAGAMSTAAPTFQSMGA